MRAHTHRRLALVLALTLSESSCKQHLTSVAEDQIDGSWLGAWSAPSGGGMLFTLNLSSADERAISGSCVARSGGTSMTCTVNGELRADGSITLTLGGPSNMAGSFQGTRTNFYRLDGTIEYNFPGGRQRVVGVNFERVECGAPCAVP